MAYEWMWGALPAGSGLQDQELSKQLGDAFAAYQASDSASSTWTATSGSPGPVTRPRLLSRTINSHVGRMKILPAFDDFNPVQAEDNEFGNKTTDSRHFTEFSLRHAGASD
jgi:hypothetical protein